MINCPSCSSSRFFYVQRVYEYHKILELKDGDAFLENLEECVVDSCYTPHLFCEDCEKEFDLNLEEIIHEDSLAYIGD